jgi:hypothetical protein
VGDAARRWHGIKRFSQARASIWRVGAQAAVAGNILAGWRARGGDKATRPGAA